MKTNDCPALSYPMSVIRLFLSCSNSTVLHCTVRNSFSPSGQYRAPSVLLHVNRRGSAAAVFIFILLAKKKHKQKMKNKTNKKQDGLLFNNISSSSRSLFHSRLIEGPCLIGVELMMMKIHVVVLLLRSCCSFSSTLFGTYC